MEWKLFELLEEKIDRLLSQVQNFSQENQELKRKLSEQSQLVEQAREQMDALEEEKTLLRDKVDGILQKIAKFVDWWSTVANLLKSEILGQEFTLKGDLEEQALEKVAAHLKEKIKEIQTTLPGANKVQISVLAALNITYDYFLLKEEFDRTMNTLETKSRQWLLKLETGFPPSPSSEV